MKNIHVLPTDKPSRIRIGNNGNFVIGLTQSATASKNDSYTNQNIYITSPNEDINENEYIITKDGRLVQVSYLLSKDLEGASKVVLATDQDLIKDGVQAIDDEFLEWFVKNPNCEEVEVEKSNLLNTSRTYLGVDKYKIIIPKEESKQETFVNEKCFKCGRSQYSSRKPFCTDDFCNKDFYQKSKQETLEEADENKKNLYYQKQVMNPYPVEGYSYTAYEKGFIEGYHESTKWQQERMYSEEEVGELLYNIIGQYGKHYGIMIDGKVLNDLFKQFKKK